MKTVLFLLQNHLSSCKILADQLSENATDDITLMLRATFGWQSGELSENSFEGLKGTDSEKEELKIKQLQRIDLEQADFIVLISESAEESLKHLLKASEKEHVIIRITELTGRSMETLEYMLLNDETDEVIKDLNQKSLELAAKL